MLRKSVLFKIKVLDSSLSHLPPFLATYEVVHAKKWERMVQEIELKVWVYNLLIGLTVGLSST